MILDLVPDEELDLILVHETGSDVEGERELASLLYLIEQSHS